MEARDNFLAGHFTPFGVSGRGSATNDTAPDEPIRPTGPFPFRVRIQGRSLGLASHIRNDQLPQGEYQHVLCCPGARLSVLGAFPLRLADGSCVSPGRDDADETAQVVA